MGVSHWKRIMVKSSYIPNRGDFVWITFDPRKGHEQGGRRPALVLSARTYNQRAGLALVCPVTSHKKGYPFEVIVSEKNVEGVVLADHIHSFDWKKRKAMYIQKATTETVEQVSRKVTVLLANVTK